MNNIDLNQIFKSYDVRGIYPETLNEEIVYKIGRAFVKQLKILNEDFSKIYIGYDMRVSSDSLKESLINGITDEGINVVDLGRCSTDTTYYASGKYNSPAIMITASHNPGKYNGMKFCKCGAQAISYEGGLKQIKEMVQENNFDEIKFQKGNIEEKDVLNEYMDLLLTFIDKDKIKPMKVVVDAGNGMGGVLINALKSKLPQLEIVPMYFEPDGNFPNHPANPINIENLQDIIAKIKEMNGDIGLAFDGDADRVYLVDNNGEPVSASITTAMVAKAMLKRFPNSKIVHNVVCSWIVPEIIEKYNGEAIETKVGHSIIKPIMRENDAIFGGEHSGHYYFRDLWYADSGVLTSLFVLEMVSEQGGKLNETLEEFRTYFAINETNTEVENKDAVLEKIANTFKNNSDVLNYKDFDGIRVDFEDWWFNVRPSNTEPVLRLNLEAKSEELMKEKTKEIISLIKGE